MLLFSTDVYTTSKSSSPDALSRRAASRASSTPRSVSGQSIHPAKRFFKKQRNEYINLSELIWAEVSSVSLYSWKNFYVILWLSVSFRMFVSLDALSTSTCVKSLTSRLKALSPCLMSISCKVLGSVTFEIVGSVVVISWWKPRHGVKYTSRSVYPRTILYLESWVASWREE